MAAPFRGGAVILCLWAALARYAVRHGVRYIIGCSSVPARDDPGASAGVCRKVLEGHLGPAYWRVSPYRPFSLEMGSTKDVQVPPLLRGYLRMGAYVCGNPAWDEQFGTADLFTLLPLDRMDGRYARRFFAGA